MDQICSIANGCGGCNYMGVDYQKQLKIKQEYCIELMEKSKFKKIKVHDTVGGTQFAYRNKIIIAFNQKYDYGLYEESTHRIVPFSRCLLHDRDSNQIIKKIQRILKIYHYSIYDEKRKRGLLRHVLIRRAVNTNQTMVVLVCNESVFPGSKNFCRELVKAFPTIKTVVMNINKRKTSIVLGDEEKNLYGKGFIVDELCGLKFKISSKSFYQINHEQCINLYNKAIDLLDLKGNEVLVDAYCGIGTIGLIASKRVKQVFGVEQNIDAVKDAINNAIMNNIYNVTFIAEDATDFMKQLALKKNQVDCVIMDPPRSGSTKEFINAIRDLKPNKVVYISCDPTTQVRDLEYFKKIGYSFKEMYPFDMFPYTKHIENIVLLERK